MIDEIKKSIDNDNEVLNILPQNNMRNRKKYKEKVEELLKEYQFKQNEVYRFITAKNSLFKNLTPNNQIKEVEEKIANLYQKVLFFNEKQTPYEIFGLDRMFYNLHKYYDNDLDFYNENISKILDIFDGAGINLTGEDFYFNDSAFQYMTTFLSERASGNINSDTLKATFANLFWKNHNMMRHILLNFKHLYFSNEKKFQEYLTKTRQELLKDYDNNYEVLLGEYKNAVIEKNNLIASSKYLYFERFINKDLTVKDYLDEKMEKLIGNFTESTDNVTNKKIFNNFYHSLKEQKYIRDYEFILEDINKLYLDKDSYKNIVSSTMKEISGKEKTILKRRKKIKRCLRWKKIQKAELFSNEIDGILTELDDLYDQLDDNRYKELIGGMVNPSLKDYFDIAKSYIFLINCMKRCEKEDVDVKKLIDEFQENIYSPYNTIISNIMYTDIENLNFIVYDKYRLIGLNLTVDDFNTENLENFISTIESIVIHYNLQDLKINLSEIDFVIKSDEIIKNRNV